MYPRGFCARFASAARAFQDKNAGAAAVFFAGVFRRWTLVVAAAGERGSSPSLAGPLGRIRSGHAAAAWLLFLFAEHLSEKGEGGRWVYRLDAVKRLHKSFVIAPRLPL